MVKSEIDDVTTYYPSAAYQVKTNGSYANTRKYYSFNGAVVAMRENGTVTWLLHTCPGGRCQGDQVNSTTVTANADGSFQSEVRYSAYGEVRHADGTTVTDKLYTGQQQEVEIGLSYYIARFYDPVIGHFIQADSIVPQAGTTVGYDRYAYVNNNPINFNDPSGNYACADFDENGKCILEKTKVITPPTKTTPSPRLGTPTPQKTKTPLPTPTGNPSTIVQAIRLLDYSPIGKYIYTGLKDTVPDLVIEYSDEGISHGLTEYDHTIRVNPTYSPTRMAGTIVHEAYHYIFPGDSLLEEYTAYLIGDLVRNDIVQAGYGDQSDLFFPLDKYNVNTDNPNRAELSVDLIEWFNSNGLGIYPKKESEGGYNVSPLP